MIAEGNGWIRIRRWHQFRTWTRVPGRAITACGLRVDKPIFANEVYPLDEARTCATCRRQMLKFGDTHV